MCAIDVLPNPSPDLRVEDLSCKTKIHPAITQDLNVPDLTSSVQDRLDSQGHWSFGAVLTVTPHTLPGSQGPVERCGLRISAWNEFETAT